MFTIHLKSLVTKSHNTIGRIGKSGKTFNAMEMLNRLQSESNSLSEASSESRAQAESQNKILSQLTYATQNRLTNELGIKTQGQSQNQWNVGKKADANKKGKWTKGKKDDLKAINKESKGISSKHSRFGINKTMKKNKDIIAGVDVKYQDKVITTKVGTTHNNVTLFRRNHTLTYNATDSLLKKLFNVRRNPKCKIGPPEKLTYTDYSFEVYYKSTFEWIKDWGFGDVAYLFDYLDPLLLNATLFNFNRIVTESKKMKTELKHVKDPLDWQHIQSKNATQNKKMLDYLKSHYEKDVYDKSINTIQAYNLLQEWRWRKNEPKVTPGSVVQFMKHYDINQDGRLNDRELILSSIYQNFGILGSKVCSKCHYDVSVILIALFNFLDCNADGYLGTEEMWDNLEAINRNSDSYDIFVGKLSMNVRTAAINDFIIKNAGVKEAYVNKDEFVRGILLGYWDRQTTSLGIEYGDKVSGRSLRWGRHAKKYNAADLRKGEDLKAGLTQDFNDQLKQEANRLNITNKVKIQINDR